MNTLQEKYMNGSFGVSMDLITRATDELEKGICGDHIVMYLMTKNLRQKNSPIDFMIENTGFPEKSGLMFLKRKMIDFVFRKNKCIEPCVKKDIRKVSIRNFVDEFLFFK